MQGLRFDKIGKRMSWHWYNEGRIWMRQGEHERARDRFDQALRLDWRHVRGHICRADVHVSLGHYHQALKDCEVARSLAPDLYLPDMIAARCFYHLREYNQCIATATKSIAKCQTDARCFVIRARGHQGLLNHKRAIEDSAIALSLDPDSIEAYSIAAYSNAKRAAFSVAVENYSIIIGRVDIDSPYASWARLGRAECHLVLKNYAEAIEDTTECLRLTQNEHRKAEAILTRAEAYRRTKAFDKALSDLEILVVSNETSAHAYFQKAVIHADLGQREMADDNFARALHLDKDANELSRFHRARARGESLFQKLMDESSEQTSNEID
ncbi:MAG: hypothetical protein K2W95_03115 [Candidatus Obscuribacterales bacterium]|nr:hypothetical protein [Candidatus Obscuribacterales bacterium]